MGNNIDLGETEKGRDEDVKKMIYMDLKTVLITMSDIYACGDRPKRLSETLGNTVKQNFKVRSIRKTIFDLFGVRTSKKMEEQHPQEHLKYTLLLGKEVWGLQNEESNIS